MGKITNVVSDQLLAPGVFFFFTDKNINRNKGMGTASEKNGLLLFQDGNLPDIFVLVEDFSRAHHQH